MTGVQTCALPICIQNTIFVISFHVLKLLKKCNNIALRSNMSEDNQLLYLFCCSVSKTIVIATAVVSSILILAVAAAIITWIKSKSATARITPDER